MIAPNCSRGTKGQTMGSPKNRSGLFFSSNQNIIGMGDPCSKLQSLFVAAAAGCSPLGLIIGNYDPGQNELVTDNCLCPMPLDGEVSLQYHELFLKKVNAREHLPIIENHAVTKFNNASHRCSRLEKNGIKCAKNRAGLSPIMEARGKCSCRATAASS